MKLIKLKQLNTDYFYRKCFTKLKIHSNVLSNYNRYYSINLNLHNHSITVITLKI